MRNENMQRTMITWHPITGEADQGLPDAELDVLVYDDDLNDTVIASVDADGDEVLWIESATGDALPSPRYWAEKPYPDEEGE
jgi:hypothetical protein